MKNLLHALLEVKEKESLAAHTTFKIGGLARYFFVAHSVEEVLCAVEAAKRSGVPFFVLGGGSNILVSDKGFDGLVILNRIAGFESRVNNTVAEVTVGAGENWDDTIARCVGNNWAGIESLSGIPGTVGAAPVQNIGAYGQSVDAVIKEVRAIDCNTMKEVTFDARACQFSYRDSLFKKEAGRFIITRVTFALAVQGLPTVTYHDLVKYFEVNNPPSASWRTPLTLRGEEKTPTIAEVRKAVIEIRARKGYIIMPGYESFATAGSFFKNPIISGEQFQKVKGSIHGCADPWYWDLPHARVKISAACLLQSAGFSKGYRKGNAGISPKHSLSLMNYGGASAEEVRALSEAIQIRVREKFSIVLEPEVQMVGDFS